MSDEVATKIRLAAELRKAASMSNAHHASKYEAFATRAETGEFDDYGDMYVCPITQLYTELMVAGLTKFAKRVADGEFDASKAESDAWAYSQSGQEAFKMLPESVRNAMFGEDCIISDVKH
jgi:DNA-binding SARP family transcriptional activator